MSSLIVHGDTLRLPLRDAQVDAIVTDPPYMIGIAAWDHPKTDDTNRHLCREEKIIGWAREWGREAYRVLRPGGYIFVCGSKRTLHLIASSEPIEGARNPKPLVVLAPSPYHGGLELAGFQSLGFLHWMYGTGQPRVVGRGKDRYVLKPAWEPIAVLAKPPVPWATRTLRREVESAYQAVGTPYDWEREPEWVKDLQVDETIQEVFGITENRLYIPKPSTREKNKGLQGRAKTLTRGTGWTKSAHENPHESKKPVDLMERLVRYACPEGGLILDPFCGSGTTGVACINIGRRFVGVEREVEYVDVARRRIADAERQTMQHVSPTNVLRHPRPVTAPEPSRSRRSHGQSKRTQRQRGKRLVKRAKVS